MRDKIGQCLCGAVSFTARDVPLDFGACYCDMCKRWAGFALFSVSVKLDKIAWTGAENIARVQTSDWAERAHCAKCGSGLWYKVTTEGYPGNDLSVPIGLLNDTSGMTLAREFYVDRKTDAYDFPADTIKMTEAEVIAMFAPTGEES
ncbi:GFA family protein [Actibacterium sp. D379-3]